MHQPDDLLPPEMVARRLTVLGCYWAGDMDDYHQGWLTAWGYWFIVPMVGRGRCCPASTLMDIEAEVRSLRPPA